MNFIFWPKKWEPGDKDNFASNEVIVKNVSFDKVLNNLIDISNWEKYYSNCSNVHTINQDNSILKLNTEFYFDTFGLKIEAKVVEFNIDYENGIARVAWEAKNKEDNSKLKVYHAWLIEKLSHDRLRILTQETQDGEIAKILASDKSFPMINGHQNWLISLVNFSK